jgi:cell division protein FtsB
MYLRAKVGKEDIGTGARRTLWLLAAATVVYGLVLGEGGVVRIRRLERENARLAQDIAALHQQQAQLQGEASDLALPGSFALEKVARERYGLTRDGERVLHVLGAEAPPAAPGATSAPLPAP